MQLFNTDQGDIISSALIFAGATTNISSLLLWVRCQVTLYYSVWQVTLCNSDVGFL